MALAGWIVATVAILVGAAVVTVLYRRLSAATAGEFAGNQSPRPRGIDLSSAAFAGLPVPAVLVDDESRVLGISRAGRAKFPFLRPGANLLAVFGDMELARRAAEVALTGNPQRFDVRLFIDQRRTFNVRIAPIADKATVVCFADRTAAADYAELRMQFVSNVSHELRTPLTGLRGLLDALDDEGLDDELRVRFAQKAQHEADRLSAIMEDVLLLSELETSSAPLAEEPTDLGEAAGAAAAALQDAAAEARVRIRMDLDDGLLVPVTPRIAEMVVTNLVANAIRYAGAGSLVSVRAFTDDDDGVLEVADDGVGISEEHLPHVFERFYRVDRSRSNRLGGTGLGLAIVKHIAERAEGVASVTSRPGYGTTVAVRLPLAGFDPDRTSSPAASLPDQVG